jgi:hypothetical protein
VDLTAQFERLVAAGIQILPAAELGSYMIFERGGFVALVERRGSRFGSIGAAGVLSDRGLAPLLYKGGQPFFVAKGFEQPASEDQVSELRRFQADLRAALAE